MNSTAPNTLPTGPHPDARHFTACPENPPPASNGRAAHLLLILACPDTRLYRLEITGGNPHELLPPLLPDSATTKSSSAYPLIAEALQTPGELLVCGRPGNTRLTPRHFLRWLTHLHPQLAARVIGSLTFAHPDLDPESLLAKARQFHAHPQPT
jgi:hypothetical protein